MGAGDSAPPRPTTRGTPPVLGRGEQGPGRRQELGLDAVQTTLHVPHQLRQGGVEGEGTRLVVQLIKEI